MGSVAEQDPHWFTPGDGERRRASS
jgi:hypothetical protein